MHGAGGERQSASPTAPNVVSTVHYSRGDVARGLAEADVVVERRYRTPMVHQGYLEPRAAVASVDAMGQLCVWTSTQALFHTRSEVAEALGLPEHRVRVVATPLGGGFGGKFVLLEPLAAALAVALRRPVAVVLTRTEEFLATTPAPQSLIEVTTGARRDGTLTALRARVIFDAGAFAGAPVSIACLMLGGYYRVPHLDIRGYEVLTHKPGNGAYRAPGAVQATFAIESQMDEVARAIGDVAVINADTEAAPYAGASGGSKITYTVGAAVERAAREARRQILAIAAEHLEAAVEDLELVDRRVRVRGVPDRGVAIAERVVVGRLAGGRKIGGGADRRRGARRPRCGGRSARQRALLPRARAPRRPRP